MNQNQFVPQDYCLVERRKQSRRHHVDRRERARFSPDNSDRRSPRDRRQQESIDPFPTAD